MKKFILMSSLIFFTIFGTLACYKTKLCCKETLQGPVCVKICDYESCPYNYPIEVK